MIAASIRIERIAAGGDGVGRLENGRAVFVPRTAPGDLIAARITDVRRRYARADLVKVVEPSPDRVDPPCPHYTEDDCGGCQLQHLSAAGQREARRGILADALRRIGKLPIAVPPLEPALDEWRYRVKLTLSRGDDGAVGLHRLGTPGRIFALRQCLLADQAIGDLWARLRGALHRLPRDLSRIVLRLGRDRRRHVVVETASQRRWRPEGEILDPHGAPNDPPPAFWWRPAGGDAQLMAGDPGPYPATAFEQVNPRMGDRVREYLIEALGPVSSRKVWDLYAGVGETSVLLARAGAAVTSVEWSAGAVEEAGRRHREAQVDVDRWGSAVEDALGDLPAPDIVIVNPPRVGLSGSVIDSLRRHGPELIGYVSCDPATLARDLQLLGTPGRGSEYRVRVVRGFDLFPQTSHVESVVILERA